MTWYIVDGMDGSGKSSVAGMLKEMLESEGRRVFVVSHPDEGCWFGRMEARYLKVPGKTSEIIATVFYVLDAVQSICRMRLGCGRYDDFIFVRYIMAVAYLPDGIYRKAYDMIERIFPMPDVRILVDVDAETAFQRIESRGEEREIFETREKLYKIREKMLALTEEGWFVIDNGGAMDDTLYQVIAMKERVDKGMFVPGGDAGA